MKNGLPYYKAYPRDFIEGTVGMSFELKGAYRLVLDLIYMQGGNLPDDARYISGLLGCSMRKWTSLRGQLVQMGKLQVSGEFLTNYRAEKELETLTKLQENQREKASKPRKNKDLQKPQQSQPEPEPKPYIKKVPKGTSQKDLDFDRFWSSVPRKVNKGAARKAWKSAVKKSDPETIIAGMERYAKERDGKDQQYTAHPASWLNGERWADETKPRAIHPQGIDPITASWLGI